MIFSTKDKLDEVLREIGYREYVYPRLINDKKLNEATAKKRIAIMWEIAEELQLQLQRELLI